MNSGKIKNWDEVPLILTIRDYSDLFNKSEESVKCDVTRAPHRLPPRLKIPGSRAVRFSKDSVIAWLEGLASPPAAPPPVPPAPPARRRGRRRGDTTLAIRAKAKAGVREEKK